MVHYRLSVAGNEYHIELTAVDSFIGPGMVVERRKRDVHVRSRPKNRSSKCHYRGFIQGHRNSQVALSACDGLVSSTLLSSYSLIPLVLLASTLFRVSIGTINVRAVGHERFERERERDFEHFYILINLLLKDSF